jgi:hydrophobic/amphiphilic exporter-1 (mainly G- bacteria), HAE1 family
VSSRARSPACRASSSISSSSNFGRSRVTVEFSDDADLDVAASDMRDAIGRIQNRLPRRTPTLPRIIKADDNAQAVCAWRSPPRP